MSREDAPEFGFGFGPINCWNCLHFRRDIRRCYKYEFSYGQYESSDNFKCGSWGEQ